MHDIVTNIGLCRFCLFDNDGMTPALLYYAPRENCVYMSSRLLPLSCTQQEQPVIGAVNAWGERQPILPEHFAAKCYDMVTRGRKMLCNLFKWNEGEFAAQLGLEDVVALFG